MEYKGYIIEKQVSGGFYKRSRTPGHGKSTWYELSPGEALFRRLRDAKEHVDTLPRRVYKIRYTNQCGDALDRALFNDHPDTWETRLKAERANELLKANIKHGLTPALNGELKSLLTFFNDRGREYKELNP